MPTNLTLYICIISILISGCQQKKEDNFKIGISQLGENDTWRKEMKKEMERELIFNPNLSLHYKQADYNSKRQIEQIKELLQEKIDLLVISPNEAAPLTSIIDSLYRTGMPIITVDRNINIDSYTTFIGTDNIEVGRLAAKYAVDFLRGKGNILEITGLPSSTPAKQRSLGFTRIVKEYPNISHKTIEGNWLESNLNNYLNQLSSSLEKIDIIFAHNDVMAHQASLLCHELGYSHIKIIGVDAQQDLGLSLVENKNLLASVLYPTGGSEVIRTAAKILNKEKVPKDISLKTIIIDSTNVVMLQQQLNKIENQQNNITQIDLLLKKQLRTFKNQKNLIIILSISIFIMLILIIQLIYLRKKNTSAYQQLHNKNNEIQKKGEQITEMAEKIQLASDQRINFFTNISHELKTPLSLIIAPAEAALQNPKTSIFTKKYFETIHSSASRLLLLVNQLIDIRKIDLNKMLLRVQEVDMIRFTSDILETFQVLARKNQIDCRLLSNETTLSVWIDVEKMEKILYNLLSNAFKFTSQEGHIYLYIEKDEKKNSVIIRVEDNGSGLTKEDEKKIFELFYHKNSDRQDSSGIGLTLTKQLVELHQGKISAQNGKNKGAVFTISLPLGKEHFSAKQIIKTEDLVGEKSKQTLPVLDFGRSNASFMHSENILINQKEISQPSIVNSILIVEDNDDLRDFLITQLQSSYLVFAAKHGAEGIQKTFDELPDLILSDIMMPEIDGLHMASILKTDIRTLHIPIILLTAKTTDENRIEGLKTLVDAYIDKPFNIQMLTATIQSLLENRKRITKHLTTEIPSELINNNKREKVFLMLFNNIIEKNIANESFSVQDICEEMNISKMQLYRKTKNILNVSINEYILQQRISKAKFLIRSQDLSFSQIAYMTGFSSASYFSTSFKKYTNETPKNYRKKYGLLR